ncbi:hypothetical protein [Klebsiella pneumoniae IS53]|nr:hypothetical protein [Klebsiella pneumoniae IS53]
MLQIASLIRWNIAKRTLPQSLQMNLQQGMHAGRRFNP